MFPSPQCWDRDQKTGFPTPVAYSPSPQWYKHNLSTACEPLGLQTIRNVGVEGWIDFFPHINLTWSHSHGFDKKKDRAPLCETVLSSRKGWANPEFSHVFAAFSHRCNQIILEGKAAVGRYLFPFFLLLEPGGFNYIRWRERGFSWKIQVIFLFLASF